MSTSRRVQYEPMVAGGRRRTLGPSFIAPKRTNPGARRRKSGRSSAMNDVPWPASSKATDPLQRLMARRMASARSAMPMIPMAHTAVHEGNAPRPP